MWVQLQVAMATAKVAPSPNSIPAGSQRQANKWGADNGFRGLSVTPDGTGGNGRAYNTVSLRMVAVGNRR